MLPTRFVPFALLPITLVASTVWVGCGGDDEAGSTPPAGVSCSRVETASSGESLRAALDGAAAGACVVVSGAVTTSTALTVRSGVSLVGAAGARASITTTDSASTAAITLADGAQLGNVDVLAAPRAGVVVDGANATLFDVTVTGAKGAGLVVSREGAPGSVIVRDVVLEKNGYGLFARGAGASVTLRGGRIAENGGTSLASGVGIAAGDGANLIVDGTTVEKNAGTGVLLDGAATRAVIKRSTIAENRERGVWGQGLQGSLEAPALTIEETTVSKNRIVGVGGVQLKGIIIVGGSVKETEASPVPTNLATTEKIGDGIGIFGGSTDFKIERTNFERNDRAAGVVDGTEVGIIIVGGKVEPGDSGLKFVVQNSSADIQIPTADKSTPPQPLGISAPKIKLPAAL